MTILEVLDPDRVLCRADITSKKRVLQQLGELLTIDCPDVVDRTVYDRLCSRERLGSTGLGKGIAIPHGRIPGLLEPRLALMTLAQGVDFDAMDGNPVDLIAGLLVPADADETHLQILATLASSLGSSALCERIRAAETPSEVIDLFAPEPPTGRLASG